jgi:spermidine dehydrogenase
MSRKLSRRDFVGGVALGAAGLHLSPIEAVAKGILPEVMLGPEYYPPGMTGIRGSHAGSFEVAHAVASEGRSFAIPRQQTEQTYDLVVVGAGISGLSAAKFFRDRRDTGSRILILDNHDDFGGHARRNELDVDGSTLIGYGGSQTIEAPSAYSKVASQLLKDIAIDTNRFSEFYDQTFFSRRGMNAGVYFDKPTYGLRRLVDNPLKAEGLTPEQVAEAVGAMPVPEADQKAFLKLLGEEVDYLRGMDRGGKEALLRNISYLDFLDKHAGVPQSVRGILQDSFLPLIGVGWEAASAWEAMEYEFPGTQHLGFEKSHQSDEPYIHHFPDGNASIARSLVRDLIPGVIPGSTMEDIVTARANYAALDSDSSPVRIRLNSTVVDTRHSADGKAVDVTYVNKGQSYRVRARHVVMACYNVIIPHICPEMPETQAHAIRYATKIPFVIGSIAIRNWQAFADAGHYAIYTPGNVLFKHMRLDFPVSMGGYQYAQKPDEPVVISAWYSPTVRGHRNTARVQPPYRSAYRRAGTDG